MSHPVPLLSFDDADLQQQSLQDFCQLGDWVRFGASQMGRYDVFHGHGFESAWDESLFLCARALQLDWDIPAAALSARLLTAERQRLWSLLQQRCVQRVPTAYLLEEAWFCGEPFKVTPDVLIPRSPIAELIESGFEPWLEQVPHRILDLCTGSGCIGIAAARMFPQAQVDLSDLSEAAVAIAVENVDAKDLGWQIDVYQGDLFDSLGDARYDLILSNPPYVDAEDIDSMPAEFHHEPRLGLAAGDDGLDLVHRILKESVDHLTDDGLLVCEVGNSAGALMDAYPELPFEWPEFSQGGLGVLILRASDLRAYFSAH
ncbi:50S ribosomal protein L3 N(5)-glutamine methyltransferase [Saccharospirillum mangrovi]|uniref:50S ribosomal protein L3 N(5)-glutamine methyltransferase n=1 Tax=Saccharospirillum mangrovi TaxID=2161747 RepID=UPI000D3AA0DC|nr:50S ribosomal protein L3 N(5)-glutamine methyltransferase [Saccharospirillum mangrovi]